jgi:predicted glycoside hydrolase/deacetylase ChbG (UPF0249 family)
MAKVIVNADDFGISLGVNEAVVKMYKEGNLTSASLMINSKYTQDAVKKALKHQKLDVGLHFNLTTGKAVLHNISIPLLTDDEGNFKNGFLSLLLLSIFKRKAFLKQVEAEMKAQIELLKVFQIKPSHIDGHRHIHYLFGVFAIASKLAKEYNIKRIRVINESLISTLKMSLKFPISGLIKWFVLRFLGVFNGSYKVKAPYFFSIIHSCRINSTILNKFKLNPKFDAVEFMIHPSIKNLDEDNEIEYEKEHLKSNFRTLELQFIKPKI